MANLQTKKPKDNFEEKVLNPQIEPLMQMTFDQLRTFALVCKSGSSRDVMRKIRREQASVEKQLKRMSDHFETVTKEPLIIKPSKKGQLIRMTTAGKRILDFAEKVFDTLDIMCDELRQTQSDRPIRCALTTFMIPILQEIQPLLVQKLNKAGYKLSRELIHIRSFEVQSILISNKGIDFSLGGIVLNSDGQLNIEDDLEFIEWHKESLCLLSNTSPEKTSIDIAEIITAQIPTILPKQGVILDLLIKHLGDQDIKDKINVVEWSDDVHFSLDLLCLGIYEASMICTEQIAHYALKRDDGKHLSCCKLEGIGEELQIGLFRRKGEMDAYYSHHPVKIFWEVFEEKAKEKKRTYPSR